MTRNFHSACGIPLRILAILLVLILLPGCAGPESGETADGDSARDSAAGDKEDIPRRLRVKTAEVPPVVYRMSRNRLNQRARAMLLESR